MGVRFLEGEDRRCVDGFFDLDKCRRLIEDDAAYFSADPLVADADVDRLDESGVNRHVDGEDFGRCDEVSGELQRPFFADEFLDVVALGKLTHRVGWLSTVEFQFILDDDHFGEHRLADGLDRIDRQFRFIRLHRIASGRHEKAPHHQHSQGPCVLIHIRYSLQESP